LSAAAEHKAGVKDFFSLVTFSHTIFAMPFAIIGYMYAYLRFDHVEFSWQLFGLVILCMIFARNAAMGFNRYADRNIDAKNARTATREIPAGKISATSALWFVVLNSLLFIATTYFINTICFYLSPVALIVILGYSITKRFTALCHVILGLGLSLAPIGAYLAVVGRFDMEPLWFSFAVLFWVSGFDIIYALQDAEFDEVQKLHSIPAWLGKQKALNLSKFLHLCSATCIWIAGPFGGFGTLYYIGALFFTGLLVYQHTLVQPNDLSKVNRAFFTTNGIASVVFACFVISDLVFGWRIFNFF
jgi:4-hydroxybenzoate polyprenyltransferase